jgi:Ti-type conjugative transfer relaxase TraA
MAIARRNGARIIVDPNIALDAITHQQATFTRADVAKFAHRHSDGKEQFDRIFAAIRASREVVYVGKDGRGEERFTSRAMLETEKRLERAADRLALRRHHGLPAEAGGRTLASAGSGGLVLGGDQEAALTRILSGPDIANVVGYAGTGKSAMLGLARGQWQRAGYNVRGAALSGIAAENLEAGSGIASRTLASLEHRWAQGRELLTEHDVLVIDEAGMIGTRQMERVLTEAEKRGAKVVLVGDPEQLQAIEAGAAFRSIAERHGAHELTTVRRQREDWQRAATRWLATERTAEAIAAYADHGAVHAATTRENARSELIDRWNRERAASPGATRIILTHTNDEVQALNKLARGRMHDAGDLAEEVTVGTARGSRPFARGDRILFLRNERSLGVKNGSLGTVESVTAARMAVMLDDGRAVAFDFKDYAHIDHGYAATIHKAQGMTVDRVHVLATPGLDRHEAYVALSRHRDGVDLHYGRDDFADQGKLVRTLSRERGKDMASDYSPAPVVELQGKPRRDMFAGLKLRAAPDGQLDLFDQSELPIDARQRPTLDQVVVRFARAAAEIVEERSGGRQESAQQLRKYHGARQAIDALQPEGARDLRAAFVRNMDLIGETAAGGASAAIAAMDWERRYRTDPDLRAEHFVRSWREMGDRHEVFERRGDESGASRIARQMAQLAKTLERDPQVESLLRRRDKDLGIPPFIERPLSQVLPQWIGWGRGRGIER